MSQPLTFDVNIEKLVDHVVYGAGAVEVAKVNISFKYVCTKMFGKCIDNFDIILKLGNPLHGIIDYRLSEPKYNIKGKILPGNVSRTSTPEQLEIILPITVKKGKAEDTFSIEVTIFYSPETIAKKESIPIEVSYKLQKEEKENRLLGEILELSIVPPYTIEANLRIKEGYEQKAFFIGDQVDLRIAIKPYLNNKIRLVVKYPGEPIVKDYIVDAQKPVYDKLLLKFTEEGDNIIIHAVDEVTGYEEKITIPVKVVKPPRTKIVDHWAEGLLIPGSRVKLFFKIINEDFMSPVNIKLYVKAYGSESTVQTTIDPEGEVVITTELDVLSDEKGEVVVEEQIESFEPITYSIELTKLPPLTKPEIKIELIDKELKIIHGEEASTGLLITNPTSIILKPEINALAPPQVEVDIESRDLDANKTTPISIKIAGLETGVFTISITVRVLNRNVVLYEDKFELKVEVIPRFKLLSAKIISPLGGEKVVIGENARLLLEVVNNFDKQLKVEIESSDNIKLHSRELVLDPGRSIYEIPCIAEKPGKATIFVRDEVYEDAIDTINEIIEPLVSAEITIAEDVFTGIPLTLKISFINQTHIAPKIIYELKAVDNMLFISGNKQERIVKGSLFMEPGMGTSSSETFTVIIPRKDRAVVSLTYTPVHIVEGKQYSGREVVIKKEFTADYPLRIIVGEKQINVKNPYPPVKIVFNEEYNVKTVDVKISNISHKQVSGIKLSARSRDIKPFYNTGTLQSNELTGITLEGKYQTRLRLVIDIPYSLQEKRVVELTASIPGSSDVVKEEINVVIEPQVFVDIFYPPRSYDYECVRQYPHAILPNGWAEVLLPISDNPLDCGTPYEASRILYSIAKEAIDGIHRRRISYPIDFYSLLAKYIIESMIPNGNIDYVKKVINESVSRYVDSQKDFIIFMELAWALTLCRYTMACSERDYDKLIEIIESMETPQAIVPLKRDRIIMNPNMIYSQMRKLLLNPYSEPLLPKDPLIGDLMIMYTLLSGKPIYNYGAIEYLIKNKNTESLMFALAAGGWKTLLNMRFAPYIRNILKNISEPKASLAAAVITRYIVYRDYKAPDYSKPLFKGMAIHDLKELSRGVV